ncbi:MAG: DUF4412 domain-containing protein [Bacteroidetes bacterium]|jgi:hypothetical protein|nr:DUF4412 domain-containing protein [Bacteroidota bacterium]
MKYLLQTTLALFLMFTLSTSAQLKDVTFNYQYDIRVEVKDQKDTELSFLLDKNEKFTGMNMNQAGMDVIVLFDTESKSSYSLMSFNGNKVAVETQMKPQKFLKNAEDFSDAKITELPDKKIAGFNAKGIRIMTKDKTYEVYYTSNADFHYYDVFKMNATETLYSKIQDKLDIPKNSIMLKSTTINNDSKQVESKMTCTSFKKIDKTIKGSEYNVQTALIQN